MTPHISPLPTARCNSLPTPSSPTPSQPPSPLSPQVLGAGELKVKGLKVKAQEFSASARSAIEAAGGECVVVPGRQKWVRVRKEAPKGAAKADK